MVIMKGSSRELMKRHVDCLIPVLSQGEGITKTTHEVVDVEQRTGVLNDRCSESSPIRKATASSSRYQVLAARNLI